MGFPLELITMLISTVLGGFMSLKASKDKAFIAALTQRQEGIQQARGKVDESFKFTRRLIALIVVLSVVLLPKVVAIFYPEIAVSVGYHEIQQGFLFFTDDAEKVKWIETKGLVITPLDSHLCAAIAGLYFGSKVGS